MAGTLPIIRNKIQAVIVGSYPQTITLWSSSHGEHRVGADAVLGDGMWTNIFKHGLVHGFHHHSFPVDAHPHIVVGVAHRILHVAGRHVQVSGLDGAQRHVSAELIINFQSGSVGADKQAFFSPWVETIDIAAKLLGRCHLIKVVGLLIISVDAVVDGRHIKASGLSKAHLSEILNFWISFKNLPFLSVETPVGIGNPETFTLVLQELYR